MPNERIIICCQIFRHRLQSIARE